MTHILDGQQLGLVGNGDDVTLLVLEQNSVSLDPHESLLLLGFHTEE